MPRKSKLLTPCRKLRHILRTPSKFNKASKLAIQLVHAGSIKHATADNFLAILEAAMLSLTTCNEPHLRADYHALFLAAQDAADVLNKKQKNLLSTWMVRAVWANDLFTDDSFISIFKNACFVPLVKVGFLRAFASYCYLKWDIQPFVSNYKSCVRWKMAHVWPYWKFSTATGRIKEAISSFPVASENDDMEEAIALKEEFEVPSTDGQTNEEEPDPFGLDALIPNVSKKDDNSHGKREVINSRKEEEEENMIFVKPQREASISCLEIAAKRYKTPWLNIRLLVV